MKMKKLISKKFICAELILLLLFSFLGMDLSYATNESEEKNVSILILSPQTETTANSQISLKIDLSTIDCENFELQISSSSTLSDASIEAQNGLSTSLDNGTLIIKGTKSLLNSNSVTVTFTIPANTEVGTTITLSVGIYNISSSEETTEILSLIKEETASLNIIETKKDDSNANDKPSNTTDNNANNDSNNQNNGNTPNQMNNNDNSFSGANSNMGIANMISSNSQGSNTSMTSTSGNMSMSSSSTTGKSGTTETVTYNGSDNNYLSNLSIDGYSLQTAFTKTNTSYFVKLAAGTTSININATAESSLATVCIYGNTNLSSGTNKILISVTAEDGSVRTYRLYATI